MDNTVKWLIVAGIVLEIITFLLSFITGNMVSYFGHILGIVILLAIEIPFALYWCRH